MKQAGWRAAAKRALDVSVAATGLVATAPLMLGVAALVRKNLGAPVLFRQERPGRFGQPFVLYKFRSMRDAHDARGEPLSDTARLTSFGAALRKTSLDELPQLYNVLRGDLSLVGPRPLLMEYLPRYSAQQARRHDVMPGITGLTQVSGRNALSWGDKFALDVEYVDTWSLWLDAKILARTAVHLLRPAGISRAGEATTPKFMG